ncbi:hypothetical protein [Amycolatopsis sp. cmx-4-61]|uniref:hypothetical protein n=1 Tax=Amycolatopsis sp. cmx-4-61 TaxID=2790937 RepID=UPI00397A1488
MTQPALPDPARTGPRPPRPRAVAGPAAGSAGRRIPDASPPGAADSRTVAGFHPPRPESVASGRHFGRGPAVRSAVDDASGAGFPATRHPHRTDAGGPRDSRGDRRFGRHLGPIAVPRRAFRAHAGVPGSPWPH